MTYTVAFDNTYPPGNTAANLISGTFRDKTTMIGERLVDILGMPDYTSDPLKVHYIRVGYGASTFGGQVRYTSDEGTLRWINGVDSAAASKDFEVYDVVHSAARLKIDNVTGAITAPIRLAVGSTPSTTGAIGIPNNIAITARNAGNTADINLIYLSASNVITFDTTVQTGQGMLVQGNFTCNGTISGNGTGLTSVPGAAVTGTVSSASTSAACTGNAATASTASNASALGGVSSSGYALLTGATFTGNISASGHNITAAAFFVG